MTKEYSDNKFDKYLIAKGGVLDLRIQPSPFRELLTSHKEKVEKYIISARKHKENLKEVPPIYFEHIHNPNLNAFAAIGLKDEYLVGINTGTLIILYDLFHRILSYNNLLTQIGNPNKELYKEPTLRNYYLDANLMIVCGDLDYTDLKFLSPKDETRNLYADLLYEIAIDFLIAHEVNHISNGHLFYFKTKYSKRALSENSDNLSEAEISIKQVFEMDADTVSGSIIISNQIKRHLKTQTTPEMFLQFYTNIKDVSFNYLYSILTLFRIMAESPFYGNLPINSYEHPFPRVRANYMISNFFGYVNKYFPEFSKQVPIDYLTEIFLEVERTYITITGNKPDITKIQKELKEGVKFSNELLDKWQLIKPEMNPYSYVKLAD